MMQFTDAVTIEGTKLRSDGYLVVDARIARTGIQRYAGSEMGRPDLAFVDVYRPEAEVFATDAMSSFAYRPVTDDHPKVAVTSQNSKELALGWTDGEVARDGHRLRVPMMLTDQALIDKVQAGKRELSAGYTCDLKWEPGTSPEGLTYDAIQTNIRANHVAVVARGRAGAECRIGDADYWGSAPITTALDKETTMTLRTVMVDGLSVETTDAGIAAITKLQGDIKTLNDSISTTATLHADALKAANGETSKVQALLDAALDKALTADQISALVADRVALEATASKIAPTVSAKGLTDNALKLAVVKHMLGDKLPAARVNDAPYIDGRFDVLAEDAGKSVDTFRDARRQITPARATTQVGLTDAQAERQAAFDDMIYFDTHGVERPAAN